MVRPILNKWHPGTGKITYWFPLVFILGLIFSVFLFVLGYPFLIGLYAIYFLVTALDAAIKQKSFYIGLLVVRAIFTQFSGYGWGFLKSYIAIHLQHKDPEKTFPKLFLRNRLWQRRKTDQEIESENLQLLSRIFDRGLVPGAVFQNLYAAHRNPGDLY